MKWLLNKTYLLEKNKLYIKLPEDCFNEQSVKLIVVGRRFSFFTVTVCCTEVL